MKEKLIIKNFGPLKSVDLDLGKITVLIGEQATGKSTMAKVLSICRYFSYIVDDSELLTNYTSRFSNTALSDWSLMGFEQDDSYISYTNSDYQVEIKNYESFDYSNPNEEPTKIPAPLLFKPTLKPISDRFKKLFQEYQKLKPNPKMIFGIQSDWRIPHSFLISDVKNVMNNPFYFPAERGLQSIFSIGKRGLENLNDKLYEQLADINSLASNFKKETQIKPLDIHYKFEKWYLNLNIDTDNLLVLNTEEDEEVQYYGTAFMDGTAQIKGYTDHLTINLEGATMPGTEFIVPLSDVSTIGDSGLINFVTLAEN